MTFREAVEATSAPVKGAFRKGIQALDDRDRKRVDCTDPNRLTGSINLDKALEREPKHANASRWDYGLGYSPKNGPEKVVWVEVHSANTDEVSAVIKKLDWLRDWLNGEDATKLKLMTNAAAGDLRFVWIARGSVKILKNSPQARRLSRSGIRLVGRDLFLP